MLNIWKEMLNNCWQDCWLKEKLGWLKEKLEISYDALEVKCPPELERTVPLETAGAKHAGDGLDYNQQKNAEFHAHPHKHCQYAGQAANIQLQDANSTADMEQCGVPGCEQNFNSTW